jgi:hypothetical protein
MTRIRTPFRPRGLTWLLVAGIMSQAWLWAGDPGREPVRMYRNPGSPGLMAIDFAVSPDGSRIATTDEAGRVALRDIRHRREMADELTPERPFDRTWALILLDRVRDQLGAEHAHSGRGAIFERLQVVLTPGSPLRSYAAFAAQLGMTEGAVQVAVHRLRRHRRAILREPIAGTLDDPTDADVEEEIRVLFHALG